MKDRRWMSLVFQRIRSSTMSFPQETVVVVALRRCLMRKACYCFAGSMTPRPPLCLGVVMTFHDADGVKGQTNRVMQSRKRTQCKTSHKRPKSVGPFVDHDSNKENVQSMITRYTWRIVIDLSLSANKVCSATIATTTTRLAIVFRCTSDMQIMPADGG